MTKFLAILGAIAATVVAIYAVKTYEHITLERHIVSNLSNKKGILESQIEKLKGEKQHIEFEIKKRSGDLYGLLEYIEKQRSIINRLQLEKKKSEKGLYEINEKKKSLDDKNTVLSESNTKLENFSKE